MIISGIFVVLYMQVWRHKRVIGLHSIWARDMSGTRFDSGMCRPTPRNLVLLRSCFGLKSALNPCQVCRHMPDLGLTNYLPSVAEIRTTRPRKLPDKTATTPIYNGQTTDKLSGRDLSNMFESSLPDKSVSSNINRQQTHKTESILITNQFLPEFDDYCQFNVGVDLLCSVRLGY